jgi:hypothetical protein
MVARSVIAPPKLPHSRGLRRSYSDASSHGHKVVISTGGLQPYRKPEWKDLQLLRSRRDET